MIWPWVLGGWVICGILAYGLCYGDFKRLNALDVEVRLLALLVGLTGPAGLVGAFVISARPYRLAWGLPRWLKRWRTWAWISVGSGWLAMIAGNVLDIRYLYIAIGLFSAGIILHFKSDRILKQEKKNGSRQGNQNPHGGAGGVAPTHPPGYPSALSGAVPLGAALAGNFYPGTSYTSPQAGQIVFHKTNIISIPASPSLIGTQSVVIPAGAQVGDLVFDPAGNITGILGPNGSIIDRVAMPSKPETALVAGPIIAYRSWGLAGSTGNILVGIGNGSGVVWQPGRPLRAICLQATNHESPPPRAGCQCGIYALKPPVCFDPAQAENQIYGKVALWGKVIEHHHGYRAEWAYPLCFFAPPKVAPMPGFPLAMSRHEELAKRYGVHVEVENLD